VRNVQPFKQQQRENLLAGVPGVTGADFLFCFVVLFCVTDGTEKKTVTQERPTNCGSGRYRMERMELYATGVTKQPKQQHGWIWSGRTTAVAGVVVWPRAGASGSTTTTNTERLAWETLHCTLHVIHYVATCRMSRVTSL
jgi:hypothetical protein